MTSYVIFRFLQKERKYDTVEDSFVPVLIPFLSVPSQLTAILNSMHNLYIHIFQLYSIQLAHTIWSTVLCILKFLCVLSYYKYLSIVFFLPST